METTDDISKMALLYFKPKVFYISSSSLDWNFYSLPEKHKFRTINY